MDGTKVNVALFTYNQAPFIEESVKSILMQETDFKFNIIVADDKSTDGTLEVIKKYAEESDIEFVFLENETNLGYEKNFNRLQMACNAEYVAFMEGDDFWTSKKRLQTHIDFLDNHLECTMSCNRMICANYETYTFEPSDSWYIPMGMKSFLYLNSEALIRKNCGPNFSACVFRKPILAKITDDCLGNNIPLGDWALHILASMHGLTVYFDDVMSEYRVHGKGLWSGMTTQGQREAVLRTLDGLDTYTEKRFSREFNSIKIYWRNDFIRKRKLKDTILRIIKTLYSIIPPVIIWIFKALLPRKLSEKLSRYK